MVQNDFTAMRYKDQQKVVARSGSPPTGDTRIRRASYYVWFLGAEECRGLRGPEVVRPVLQTLLEREREHEPEKVTLQVSGRGIKLLQQGVTIRAAAAGSTKHFIPCGALTHVQQEEPPDDDIVSAVLLIYNPLTRCPVHVHSYRCDSTETAEVLKLHLQQLLQRPEQQAKLSALESRLASRGLLPSTSSRASDGASSGSSVSSGAGSGSGRAHNGEKMASLYDSLAAELREKLGTRNGPILLPPKDYDKAGRRRKKLPGIDITGSRKALEDDSNRSSGIGSDDAPSPTQERDFGGLEHQSSSDEEWAGHESAEIRGEASLVLVQPTWRDSNTSPRHTPTHHHQKERSRRHQSPAKNLSPIRIAPIRRASRRMKDSISPVSPRDRFQDARDKFISLERQRSAGEIPAQAVVSHPDGIDRSTSWDAGQRNHQIRRTKKDKRDIYSSREELAWPRSDRDTGYGSRDALLRDKRQKEVVDSDPWKRDAGRKTPDIWEFRGAERSASPNRGRARTPVKDHRVPRVRSPDRHEYQRAKSMHDLSQRRVVPSEDKSGRDPRRRSLYDPADDAGSLQDSRRPAFSSHTHLARPPSSSSSHSSTTSLHRYGELPDHQRFPGLDRATARMDTLEVKGKRTFDYPVNGGHAPIHITRAYHDDYRRFRYEHGNGSSYMRAPAVPPALY